MNNRGFTAVEMIISLIIVSIITAVFYSQMSMAFKTWQAKQLEGEVKNEVRDIVVFIKNKVAYMDRDQVMQISDVGSPTGYIQFKDVSGNAHAVVYNNDANQLALSLVNAFSKQALIYYFHDKITDTTTNEIILDDVIELSFTLYESTTDMFPTTNIHDAGSLGLKVIKNARKNDGTIYPAIMETLVYLRKDNFARPSVFAFGAFGHSFDTKQDGVSINTFYYDDFSNLTTIANHWTTINVNAVNASVTPADRTMHLTQIPLGAVGEDKLRCRPTGVTSKLPDEEFFFTADFCLQATSVSYIGNKVSLRLEDSYNPAGHYIDFVLENGWFRLYNMNDGVLTLVSQQSIGGFSSSKYYNLAIFYNKSYIDPVTNMNVPQIEAYFDLDKEPVGIVSDFTTSEGFYINFVHTRVWPNKKEDVKIKNFAIARTPLYNMNVFPASLTLVNPADSLTPNAIAPDRIYGMFQSPTYNVNNYLPAHFDKLILNQNNALPTLKRTVIFLNVDRKGWVELSPSPSIDCTYPINNLVGSTMQYRLEYHFSGDDPAAAFVSTINMNW